VSQSTRRMLAHGTNATLVTGMVVVVLALVYLLADAYRQRFDLSEGASNTLQVETLEKLRLIDQDGQEVMVTAFTSQRGKEEAPFKDQAVEDLLKALDQESVSVQWRLLDFDKERLTAERLSVTEYGHIVVQRGEERVDISDRELFRRVGTGPDKRVEFVGESAISRAFSQVMAPSQRVAYVLIGHGELSADQAGPGGLSTFAGLLDRERYEVRPLDLMRSDRDGNLPSIPDDASVVVIARPQLPLTAQEEDALLGWIGRGGAILLAVDVGLPAPDLLRRVGITVPEGVALQPEMQVPYRDRPIPRYRSHPITTGLIEDKLPTVLSHPAPLRQSDPPVEGLTVAAVLQTSRDGWIDRGGALEGGGAIYEPAVDVAGPVDLAYAVELRPGGGLVRAGRPAARLLVLGDADLLSNSMVADAPGNAVFALHAMHWLAGDDRRLGVVAGAVGRATRSRRLAITAEDAQVIRWVSLALMPGLVALAGLLTFLSRRGR